MREGRSCDCDRFVSATTLENWTTARSQARVGAVKLAEILEGIRAGAVR